MLINFDNSFSNWSSKNYDGKSNNNTDNDIYGSYDNTRVILQKQIIFLTFPNLTPSLPNIMIVLVTIIYTKKENNKLVEQVLYLINIVCS